MRYDRRRPRLDVGRLHIQNHQIGARDRLDGIVRQDARRSQPVAAGQGPVRRHIQTHAARRPDGLQDMAFPTLQREPHIVPAERQIARHRRAHVALRVSDNRDTVRHAASVRGVAPRASAQIGCPSMAYPSQAIALISMRAPSRINPATFTPVAAG